MNSIITFNTISKQFSKHESELLKLEFDVNASAASTVYVQIHDFPQPADLAAGRTAPAAGSVPIKSWPTPPGAIDVYKEFKRGDLSLTYGLFVCVSTTQATLTIGTGNNKFDSVAAELISADVVGTEVNSQSAPDQEVWTGATEHRLVRCACVNLENGIRWLMLFHKNASGIAAGGDTPIMQWQLAATGDSGGADIKLVSFGGVGNNNLEGVDLGVPDPATITAHKGCTFGLSTTQYTYTPTLDVGANFYVEYK